MAHPLKALAQPFDADMIQEYQASGYHASFVSHADVAQKLLAEHGPYSWEIIEIIREHDAHAKEPGVVTGVVGKLTLEIDGRHVVISEVGEYRHKGAQPRSAGDRAKNASSDAFKRAAMRAGRRPAPVVPGDLRAAPCPRLTADRRIARPSTGAPASPPRYASAASPPTASASGEPVQPRRPNSTGLVSTARTPPPAAEPASATRT